MSSRYLTSLGMPFAVGEFLGWLGLVPFVHEPLSRHCTWRIGGPADFLVEPASWRQVASILDYSRENSIPAVIVGKGSNLLFDDAGLRGVVIKIGRKLADLSVRGTTVLAGSGIAAPRLARSVGLAGLSGLEHIVGIPGTLGGLVVMNGGSQRKTIGDVILEVKAMDREGAIHVFHRDECAFTCRHSRFQDGDWVVAEATMELTPGHCSDIMAEMLDILRRRRRRFPLNMPNCGSVFKSTPELYDRFGPPGQIIDELGLKGFRVGNAMIDNKHANFIVNMGSATASDVMQLVNVAREAMRRAIGIDMECEVRYVDCHGQFRALDSELQWEIP